MPKHVPQSALIIHFETDMNSGSADSLSEPAIKFYNHEFELAHRKQGTPPVADRLTVYAIDAPQRGKLDGVDSNTMIRIFGHGSEGSDKLYPRQALSHEVEPPSLSPGELADRIVYGFSPERLKSLANQTLNIELMMCFGGVAAKSEGSFAAQLKRALKERGIVANITARRGVRVSDPNYTDGSAFPEGDVIFPEDINVWMHQETELQQRKEIIEQAWTEHAKLFSQIAQSTTDPTLLEKAAEQQREAEGQKRMLNLWHYTEQTQGQRAFIKSGRGSQLTLTTTAHGRESRFDPYWTQLQELDPVLDAIQVAANDAVLEVLNNHELLAEIDSPYSTRDYAFHDKAHSSPSVVIEALMLKRQAVDVQIKADTKQTGGISGIFLKSEKKASIKARAASLTAQLKTLDEVIGVFRNSMHALADLDEAIVERAPSWMPHLPN